MENSGEMSSLKKKRSANFTREECFTLVNLVDQFVEIVECKKSNATTNKEKDQAWEKIAVNFNAATASCRTAKQLKEKYENVKKEAKKMLGRERQEILRTGGGPETSIPKDHILEKVAGIMGVSAAGMPSTHDDDDISAMLEEEEVAAAGEGEDEVTLVSETTDFPIPMLHINELEPLARQNSESEVQEWSKYAPAMLKRKRNSNLIVTPSASRRRPQMCDTTISPSASGQKLHSWASARTEVAFLQKELLQKEFEAKQEREKELHSINMKIKEEELLLIRAKRKLVEMDVEAKERQQNNVFKNL